MPQAGVIAFNIGAFISTLFLLEFGADKFIDHAASLAAEIGVSQVVIGLLTAGAEWEELAVVIASIAQDRSSLALGNIVGSAISNIIGAFSLGLLFYASDAAIEFDRSSKIYSLILLCITTAMIPLLSFPNTLIWTVGGSVLIVAFGVYLIMVAIAIGRRLLVAPEDSDSSDSNETDNDSEETQVNSPLLPRLNIASQPTRQLRRHTLHLMAGFAAICLAGYVLSQAAINIIDELGMSDMLFSIVILAIATTLPEKFVSVMSGSRGHIGILVANCVGSNIFLLTLCGGITMIYSKGNLDGGVLDPAEMATLWASTAAFTGTVWFGARIARTTGAVMIVCYIAFIVLEFTVLRKGLQ